MGKWRGIFFLAAFFSGVVLGSELFFQSFSLRSLRVESGDPVAELFFWKNISSSALRFWPFFFLEKDELKKKIESESPLSCSITRRGIAGAEIRIDPSTVGHGELERPGFFCYTRRDRLGEQSVIE